MPAGAGARRRLVLKVSAAPLELGTGGPKSRELLMELEIVRQELPGLRLEIGREIEREVVEGKYHKGTAAVVQILAVK